MLKTIATLFEKAVATFIQAWVTVLLAGSVFDVSAAKAAAIAAVPATLTVIANGIPQVGANLPFYVDLVLRTIRTYAVAFVGFMVAVPVFELSVSAAQAAALAAVPAVLAVIKGGLASKVGDTSTAALLPKSVDVDAWEH